MRRRMFLGVHYTIMTMDGHMAMKEGKVILIPPIDTWGPDMRRDPKKER